jgi:SAM-dependent methyltransferase
VSGNVIRRALGRLARQVGLRRAAAPPAREEGAEFYDALYRATPEYHEPYQKSFYYFLWSVIVDRVRRAGIKRVLEIGCGPGQLAAYLFDSGVEQYVGLDFSPQAIEMARKNAPRGRFVVGDARDGAIHAQTEHDVVICTEVLEHIEDDLKVVSAFRPGKRCLCSVPNFPYESHVRHFKDAGEVLARYGAFFDRPDVMTFRSPRSAEDLFFLLDGVRS